MQNTEWVILDTETTGFSPPIFVVEIAAQRMRGWEPDGKPFRRMLNHGTAIPPEASRVHGYTREILERDGDPPFEVYREFADYVGERAVAAYNLRYDWDDVLLPEWQRLGVTTCGTRGICMMQLARRLLDPVAAGNCKLQTLRQYYNLPARGAHTALGDVETVIDLAQQVLRPLAEARGLAKWDALVQFSEAVWFPARITFGKFKGRLFQEALKDNALHSWLKWLASSSNPRSAQMGEWYLEQLQAEAEGDQFIASVTIEPISSETGLLVFIHPDVARLNALIEAARTRLAELEASYTSERHSVSLTEAKLFELLRPFFQKRDQLKLRLESRRKYLEALLYSGEEEAHEINREFEHARAQTDAEYERAANEFVGREALNDDEQAEIKGLWRKLVRLFHPDRYMGDEAKQAAFQKLTAEINRARDAGDIERLREIANDPEGFMARQGWGTVTLDGSEDVDKLKHLYEALEGQIIALLESIDDLHQSSGYELYQLSSAQSDFLAQVAKIQSQAIEEENNKLEAEVTRLESEIAELER